MSHPEPPIPINLQRLHHVGIVTGDLDQSISNYTTMLGFTLLAAAVVDPIQKVDIAFLTIGGGPLLELLHPFGEDSPLLKFADSGRGLHHLCYEVDDIENALEVSRGHGAIVVCSPVPAIAIDSRLVAFIYTRERQLIEFLQSDITN